MKKSILLLFTLLAASILTAQPLTHRGGNEFPGKTIIATMPDFQPGDEIIGCYESDGILHASEIRIARSTKFQAACWGNDQDSPVKTGLDEDEEPIWVLYRQGKTYLLQAVEFEINKWFSGAELINTGTEVEVLDNLYYWLCPQWPDATEYIIPEHVNIVPGRSYSFYQFFKYSTVMPQFYEKLEISLKTGSGRLYQSRTLNMYRYWFRPDDFDRGLIELKVNVIPLKHCANAETERVIRINL
jgi:hypothetical protein